MKIVITCPRYFSEIENLENILSNQEVSIKKHNPKNQGFNYQEMEYLLKDADVAIIGDDYINREIVKNLPNLKLIIKWGVGTDNIEIDKNSSNPIILNSPADIYLDVAEHTVFLIGALFKKIPFINDQIKNKHLWTKPVGNRIAKKNVGLIGYGMIGKQVSKILSSFDANFYYFDPYVETSKNDIAKKADLKVLAEKCDIIIVSASLTEESEYLIDKDFFSSLLKKPVLINVSRGKIINENRLVYALNDKLISGCALDVFEEEPINKENQLKNFENVIFSSHNASNTYEANNSVNSQITKSLLKWIKDGY
ncbi:MAG: hypothetical protein CMC31_05890 [Flavobacteriaceae bacterium]|nr:hypothetical protein [Flavobacteriaceae bacterium]